MGLSRPAPCAVVGPQEDALEPKRRRGLGPLPTHDDSLKQTYMTTAIIESAEAGKVVEVG